MILHRKTVFESKWAGRCAWLVFLLVFAIAFLLTWRAVWA